jgi:nucleotide-binding universal stress UspA family protein
MFERILLAVDGSEHSMRAAKEAGDLARAMKSDILRIVVAFDGIPRYLGEPNREQAIQARLKEANEILQKAQEAVGKIPGELPTELIEGSPAEAIINVAKIRGSSVIVMGSRGLSSIAELLLGSTSHKVVSHASCPVLIVR